MDQRSTTTSRLEEELFPGVTIASLLGQLLRAPVRDIPTEEDYRREQGELGVTTEAQSSRQTGQDVLDWLAQAFGVAGILRGSAAGREQELMGKGRGIETFGKEMMETSRRAYPKKWEQQRAEQWRRPDEPEIGIEQGRQSYREPREVPWSSTLPPGETPQWRRGEALPADVVQRGQISAGARVRPEAEIYRIGAMVPLPGGREMQYVVVPGKWGATVSLYDGERIHLVESYTSIGEALAKARQLQNRLALAAKDSDLPYAASWTGRLQGGADRELRLPWERSTEGIWRGDYSPPPDTGRWSEVP